ncbi:hypothetical protein TRFO_10015 [Tritrichomonas foetus]|uniref:Peptidase M60 domain-containing protein n=1 Tax=Tritrichomonas foetus TaxID=1144522 RepID=A0A1J4JDJ5_9EUKA|nr:hypothetical protein TRFO_10015 [Tritrichomonas foetus]|eukprot:OHS96359.1 hypothetical protein TRFO_10015 [Tritrichomonas foetus]
MGCSNSIPSRKVEPKQQNKRPPDDSLYTYVDESSPRQAFEFIIKDSSSFLCTSSMIPSVCLTKNAFPIINTILPLDDTGQASIELPVLTAAFAESGRVMCFPHAEILEDLNDHSSTARIFQRALSWLAHQKSTMTPILLLGFTQEFTNVAKNVLHTFGFFVEDSQRLSKLGTFRVVLIPSTFDVSNTDNYVKLVSFVENGGGLAVFFWPLNDENPLTAFPINKLLSHFGLSYTFCSIDENESPIQINPDFDKSISHHFLNIIQQMETSLLEEEINDTDLDNIVTTVRYHVIVSDDDQKDQIVKLGNVCTDYLDRVGFADNFIFNPDVRQIIILLLLQDIIPRLPVDSIKPAKGYEAFPGKCEETSLSDFEFSLEILDEEWISTGLYLPSGVVGTVITEQPFPNLHLQVGAHHESLIQKAPPWKRWPSIVSAFPLNQTETKLASPYGGPVYIAASEQIEGALNVKFIFKNFVQYPRLVKGNPEVWEATKDKKVPFGEFECDHIILSMPTEQMLQLDFEKVCDVIDAMAARISQFMCYPLARQFRVVFDIDLTENGASFGYPIVFSTNDILPMFGNLEKPSMALFTLINLMGIVTLPEGCFDSTIEAALASVAASVAFRDLNPDFDPVEFATATLPKMFTELWKITTQIGDDIIPQTLKKFQDPNYEIIGVPEDTWIEFVREMCRIGRRDFTKILEQSRPIPLSVSMSCHTFQPFVPMDEEGEEEASPLVCQ